MYTYEQRLEFAKKARVPRVAKIPESYEAYLDKVDVKECYLEARNGKTHYYKVQSKDKKSKAPMVLNMHGGGFCKGHLKQDVVFSAMIAVETGAVVLDLDYKLSPECTFPVAYQEGYDLAKWAYENDDELGIDKSRIMLCGHSAGANLAAAIALESTRTKDFEIKLQILDYPPTDLYTDPAVKYKGMKTHYSIDLYRAINAIYVPTEEMAKDPHASMLFATPDMLKGLPDALVITAGLDDLRFEGEQYAFKMVEAGVKVTIKRYMNSNHGFIIYYTDDEWQKAHKLIKDTIKSYK